MKCTEGTKIEEWSKWLKKHKKEEQSKGKQVIERKDQGRQINKEYRSWIGQQVEEDTNGFFGAPRGEEGRTGR
jgi:hypothetical protein